MVAKTDDQFQFFSRKLHRNPKTQKSNFQENLNFVMKSNKKLFSKFWAENADKVSVFKKNCKKTSNFMLSVKERAANGSGDFKTLFFLESF